MSDLPPTPDSGPSLMERLIHDAQNEGPIGCAVAFAIVVLALVCAASLLLLVLYVVGVKLQ